MRRNIDCLFLALIAIILFASCKRVAPNYAGSWRITVNRGKMILR